MQTILVTKGTKQKAVAKVGKREYIDLSGIAELTTARKGVYRIVAWYSDSRCRTTSGDVWEVSKCNTGEADFVAIK